MNDVYDILEEKFKTDYRVWYAKIKRKENTPEVVEDAIQIACERAMKYSKTFDSRQNFNAWFNSLLKNAMKDCLHDEKRGGLSVEYKEELDYRIESDGRSGDLVESVISEIDTYPSPQKEVLHLYFIHGLKPREIGHFVDCSYHALNGYVKRFKKHLEDTYG
jgi:RNA polymerase sigma factor (sigma-70 family)